jgi:aryl-alcohol dehydrogenase-like predicted oxidoreductase
MVSRIGFGGWGIGGDAYGRTDDAVSAAAIEKALSLGCNLFETSDFYGQGHSEQLLGRVLRDAGALETVVIASKGGRFCTSGGRNFDFSLSGLTRSVEGSLKRLGRDYIDVYQLHNPPLQILKSGLIDEALSRLIERGLIHYAGVSVDSIAEARVALTLPSVEVLQMKYNLLSLLDSGMTCVDLAASSHRRCGMLGREPLANGFLSGRHTMDTNYPAYDIRREWPPALRRQRICLAASLLPLANNSRTLAQVALRFALDEPSIDSVLVGMKTPAQVQENIGALALPAFRELATEL